jgi:serine/threonine-protein kinase
MVKDPDGNLPLQPGWMGAAVPTLSIAALVKSLREYRLLDVEQLNELLYHVQMRFPTVHALTEEMVRRGWLTPFQSEILLAGDASELNLGSYVLLDQLGEGGMGQVFKARHVEKGNTVAIKIIRNTRLCNPEVTRRFQREAKAAARLAHPNIVALLESSESRGRHFLVMEFLLGTDLARLLKKSGPVTIAQAVAYVSQAAQGLQHAYEKGLVHRDIKPSNLLVTSGYGASLPEVVKILDFGLARLRRASDETETTTDELTRNGALMGTPNYMAPEQATDPHAVDIRADIYSLGCTFYHLLTGRPPFPGGSFWQKINQHREAEPVSVESLRPDLPGCLARVVRRMMAKRPAERFQTPNDLVANLRRFERDAFLADLRESARSQQGIGTGEVSTTTYRPRSNGERAASSLGLSPRPVLSSITNLVGIKMVLIPAGSFVMGSPESEAGRESNESPEHKVTISKPFFIGAFQITQGQFKRVMGQNPSHFNIKNRGSDEHPVETVSWHDARAFCNWLSALDTELMEGQYYRLPTEGEWEYACRSGCRGSYSFGHDSATLQSFGWFRDNAGGMTQATGQLCPNSWGLYDMHGNVWEWCADFYKGRYYEESEKEDPRGPATGRYRVIRGGSWFNEARFCRSTHRSRHLPTETSRLIGFRIVCVLEQGNTGAEWEERSELWHKARKRRGR